jgi:hypothetical protein
MSFNFSRLARTLMFFLFVISSSLRHIGTTMPYWAQCLENPFLFLVLATLLFSIAECVLMVAFVV